MYFSVCKVGEKSSTCSLKNMMLFCPAQENLFVVGDNWRIVVSDQCAKKAVS